MRLCVSIEFIASDVIWTIGKDDDRWQFTRDNGLKCLSSRPQTPQAIVFVKGRSGPAGSKVGEAMERSAEGAENKTSDLKIHSQSGAGDGNDPLRTSLMA